jgi:hypothetical protein
LWFWPQILTKANFGSFQDGKGVDVSGTALIDTQTCRHVDIPVHCTVSEAAHLYALPVVIMMSDNSSGVKNAQMSLQPAAYYIADI